MSAEFEAAQEICSVLHAIDQNLDRIYKDMPSQRERIATAAMIGYLSNPNTPCTQEGPIAKQAVIMADALIAQLDATENGRIDSRLIAAAPDLLAYAEMSEALGEYHRDGSGFTSDMVFAVLTKHGYVPRVPEFPGMGGEEWIRKFRTAAIAKAKSSS